MTDVVDLTEVFSETLARVRARMDADANAGLTQDDPAWIDLREGTFYWDMTQPAAMECARLWDAMTETVAAAFPSTAWGDYLDEHGTTFSLTRTPAAPATGYLLFIASAATLIAAGVQASTSASSTGDVTTFATTASGTTSAPLAIPSSVAVGVAQSGGYLTAGTRYYHVTAVNQYGETTGSADQSGVTTSAVGVNTLTWAAVPGDFSNLVVNPNFEYDTTGAAPAAWISGTGAGGAVTVFQCQGGWASVGTKSARLTGTVPQAGGQISAQCPASATSLAVQPGVPYTLSIAANALTLPSGVNAYPQINWYTSAGVFISANTGTGASGRLTAVGIGRVTVTGTSPSNAAYAIPLFVINNSNASGGTLTVDAYFDAVLFAQTGAFTAYTDGDQPSMAWAGTPGNSVSNPTVGPITYNVYTTQTANSMGALLASVTTTNYTDNGTVTPNASLQEPQINTTSGVLLAAQAVTPGSAGNVGAGAVASLDTVIPAVMSVTNPSPMQGGSEEEADDDFRDRILGEYVGTSGGGNSVDYKRWAASQGIERTTVAPVWNGAGTVLVIAMNNDGSPVSSQTVTNLQAFLDPFAGQGAGQAPIGATVTVTTSTVRTITISAGVKGETGYTLDGTAGTIATRAAIMSALTAYLTSLQPGDTLVYTHALATFFVTGVHQVINLQINGGSSDITLGGLTPPTPTPQIASLGAVTLTDA